MHILELTAENIKRLDVIAITPKGPVIQITGPNASGKTSVLDCIWWALEGARHIQAEPIRKGTSRARIKLDLGELVVERKFTAKGTYLTVESADGRLFKQPQQMLDALFGALTFDPLAFMQLDPRRQYEVLTSTVALPVDPQAIAEMNAKTASERTEVNRERTRLTGVIASLDLEIPKDLPAAVPDTDALIAS